ncbi:hypothetical protein EVAR_83605_1 [Eumeta japonica]|uniref:Uncharacterized protein n=1 Tax=Eumeta variegata TaxID=151549 RepID=A0A4C1UQ59_EUMVA|nr:hypothetical protein EVAR_83605_1 [Eumeta japonica]
MPYVLKGRGSAQTSIQTESPHIEQLVDISKAREICKDRVMWKSCLCLPFWEIGASRGLTPGRDAATSETTNIKLLRLPTSCFTRSYAWLGYAYPGMRYPWVSLRVYVHMRSRVHVTKPRAPETYSPYAA